MRKLGMQVAPGIAAVLLLGWTASAFGQAPTWTLETGQAAWQPRDSCGELVFNGRMWMLGGWFDSFHSPPRDVWSSADGKSWQLVTPAAPWKHGDFPMTAAFREQMWVLGGWYNGRLPDHSASHEVWSSRDGATWNQVTAAAPWSARIAGGVVVFQDKLWLLGGTENYYFGDATSLKNDVWYSEDGQDWQLATEHAEWSPRAYHAAVVHDGKMWIMGGGNYVPEYQALNDVWCSADGVHWTQVTAAAAWSPRIWFSAAVYRDRLWVLGGWSNNPSRNWGDVWTSRDGKTWTPFTTAATWKERHEHSTFVFQDKLWVAGGHAQPLSNEVWSLDVPADWFRDHP